jgi:hypothetical protein
MAEGQFAVMLNTHKVFWVLHDPVARELAPAGSRSGPKKTMSAAHSSGSKLPRHKNYPAITPQIDQR